MSYAQPGSGSSNQTHGHGHGHSLAVYHSPAENSLSSSIATSPDTCHQPISAQYLQELLKDKRTIQNFPNVFHHLDRILETEISRARSVLYHQNGSSVRQLPDDLPEGEGPVVTVQEKVFIPVKDNPNYNFVGRLLGPRGMTAKQLETDLDCKIMVRGKGSMRDKKKEEQNRGKPNWEHLADELHVLVSVEDHQNRAELKAKRAAEEIRVFLEQAVKMPSSEDSLKRKQLIEVAIINGTYRDTSGKVVPGAGSGKVIPFDRRLLNATRASNAAAALSAAAAAVALPPALGGAGPGGLTPAQAAAFLRMPAGGASLPPHFMLSAAMGQQQHHHHQQQQQQQQQQLMGFPLMQAAPADFSSYLLAAAAASAAATSAASSVVPLSAGAGGSQAPGPGGGGAADQSAAAAAAMMALMYQGAAAGLDVFAGGQSGPMKSRQGATSGLRAHPYSRPGF